MATRRDFLHTCACAAAAGTLGWLAAGCYGEKKRRITSPEVTGSFDVDLNAQPQLATENSAVSVPGTPAGTIFVTRTAGDSYFALSRVCTHQGCTVDLPTGEAPVLLPCPCHGSRYNLDGTVAQGPAARALQSWPVSLNANKLKISFG